MENIIVFLNQFKEVLAVIVALVMFAIVSYKQIMAELSRKEAAAKKELTNIVTGLITTAETKPNELLQSLVNKPETPLFIGKDATAETKESLVLTALKERNPNLLKKAKLKDIPAILSFIGNVYQGIKPLVKILRK